MKNTNVSNPTNERGFTLAEVLVATFIIVVGLVALASGFQFATSGVATGRGETVASFLAEQRLEQLKAIAMTNYYGSPAWTAPLTLANNSTTTEYCQTSNIGATGTNCQTTAITGTASYVRTTRVTDNPGGTGCTGTPPLVCKRIWVNVTYRPVTTRGDVSQTRSVDVYAVVAPRN
jgi:prepilin-type N-terminal cleavage/methylation domain-containing protein